MNKKSNNKKVYTIEEAKEKIFSGLEKVCQPVIQTISPKGRNCLFEDSNGNPTLSNDGITIIRQIELEDPIENFIAQSIKQASLTTNNIAGDGTSTSALLSYKFIKEGFKLIDSGWNPMVLKKELEKAVSLLLEQIKELKYEVKTKNDLNFIAKISSNDDDEIAKNVVEIVEAVGENGNVFIDNSNKEETELVKEQGFLMKSGMFSPEFVNQKGRLQTLYNNVKVLVLDKRVYYDHEAIAILEIVMKAGFNSVVIVARDFIGKAPAVFVTNHVQQKMNILCVKDPLQNTSGVDKHSETLEDLADYLGCQVFSEKKGNLTNNLKIDDFGTAKLVLSNVKQTLITTTDPENVQLTLKIASLKEEIEKNTDEREKKPLEDRLASLTNGMVTVKVGGKTPMEIREKKFRIEDSINATRNSLKSGYVIGSGLTLWKAFKMTKFGNKEIEELMKKVCISSLQQICINCGAHFESILEKINELNNLNKKNIKNLNFGFDATDGQIKNLKEAGIIEPLLVVEQSLKNSLSIACAILSSGYVIVNQIEENEKD